MVENYKKGVDITPLISKLKDIDISIKEPTSPTGTGNKGPTEISKKRYGLELKNTWIGKISLKRI